MSKKDHKLGALSNGIVEGTAAIYYYYYYRGSPP